MVILLILSALLSSSLPLKAEETCSRIATINSQEILVDTNPSQKGEGLRYQLSKDPKANQLLNQYQEGNDIKWRNAAFGTVGTTLVLLGMLSNSSGSNKKALVFGGASIILLNFLIARTLEYQNESKLMQSIKEYNKRNLPRIYFGPRESYLDNHHKPEIYISKSWSF